MHTFIAGQRWINQAELQLGLGTILSVEQRTITILFQATGETRTYSKQGAPLTRVLFGKGDQLVDQQGRTLTVLQVEEQDGLYTYRAHDAQGQTVQIGEAQLDHQIRLNRPLDRLLTGQVDDNRWFELRCETLGLLDRYSRSPVSGLTGGRTDLIPHQLYIAHEVGRRHAPRVLLADEVGLGKTIEAGMILHEQLVAERIRRVLIVVPENLLHQWLVEMLRRFNLRFALFDEERYQAMVEFDETANPFEQEQLVLCSLDLLTGTAACLDRAVAAGWDMLIVDEAHHLAWSPEQSSPGYLAIERLAEHTAGVLLLTATPEQLGRTGHYARLRLLDPARFPSYDRFIEEEMLYAPVAEAIESLFRPGAPTPAAIEQIRALVGSDSLPDGLLNNPDPESRQALMNRLLDHHGTGRVLFRNTRAAIQGFPERRPVIYPLPPVSEYRLQAPVADGDQHLLLAPERYYRDKASAGTRHWSQFDPRLPWLRDLLLKLKPEKVLVICASGQTALEVAEWLRQKSGLPATAFHEQLSIVERDRVAAWFAEQENGAQVMICSEIGSEGRNFQFAHHLVLFDLPLNPDLLEQRIGRLDRIGQKHPVNIHIPYIEQTAQAGMVDWYARGLDAFARPCPAGQAVYERLEPELLAALGRTDTDIAALIDRTRLLNRELNEALEQGRDRLLEYNSCRPDIAASLHRQALQEDQTSGLAAYMDKVFDCFGVHSEEHGAASLILTPAENMLTAFPQLPDDGLTVTFDRRTALAHEDRQFLSFAHPMVSGVIDLILGSEHGNTAVVTFKHPDLRPGLMMLECNYLVDSASAASAHIRRYLPPILIRLLLDEKGKDHAALLDRARIGRTCVTVDRETAQKVIAFKQAELRALVGRSGQLVATAAGKAIAGVRQCATTLLQAEIGRLRELARVNPNVREQEIRYFENELEAVNAMLNSALPRLDAIRVLIAT